MLEDQDEQVDREYNFRYSILLEGAEAEHEVNFDFRSSPDLPFRITVLIGRNGTGKTQLISSMVNTASGLNNKGKFLPQKPLFSNFIAISYSLFDKFPTPAKSKTFSYKYIGFRTDDDEIISDEKIENKLRSALREIKENDKEDSWFEAINEIIDTGILGIGQSSEITENVIKRIVTQRKNLSSGQSIMLFTITELIANIQRDSLVLFDEPETHLHPNALAQLINVFYSLLKKYKSYAIVSTHSPIVLQDIPSSRIQVFDRQGNIPIIRELPIESFGENISKITSTIFETVEIKELYKTYLETLANRRNVDYINRLFPMGLSINAQYYLSALIELKNEES